MHLAGTLYELTFASGATGYLSKDGAAWWLNVPKEKVTVRGVTVANEYPEDIVIEEVPLELRRRMREATQCVSNLG